MNLVIQFLLYYFLVQLKYERLRTCISSNIIRKINYFDTFTQQLVQIHSMLLQGRDLLFYFSIDTKIKRIFSKKSGSLFSLSFDLSSFFDGIFNRSVEGIINLAFFDNCSFSAFINGKSS